MQKNDSFKDSIVTTMVLIASTFGVSSMGLSAVVA